MRAEGARVGVGELLDRPPRARGGRRELARGRAAGAARGAVLAARGPRALRARVHGRVRRRARSPGSEHSLDELGRDRARGAAARRRSPDAAPSRRRRGDRTRPRSRPPGARSSCCGTKDFAQYTDAEMALARELIARLARRGPTRLSRRTRPVRRRAATRPTCGACVRASLRTAGEPVTRHWRAPSVRPRPVVLVCDVSGSMKPVRADAAPVPARVRRRAAARRGVRVRHAADADHQRARRPRPRPRARARRRGGHRLRGRNADRRGAGRAQPRPRPPARSRRRRRDPVRRLGSRRPRAARRTRWRGCGAARTGWCG